MHSVALSKTGHVSFTLCPVTLFMSFSLLTEGETIPLWIPPQIRLIFLSVSNTHIHQQTSADEPKHFLSSLIVKFPRPFCQYRPVCQPIEKCFLTYAMNQSLVQLGRCASPRGGLLLSLDWEDNRTNLSLSLSLPLTGFLLPPMVTATQSSLLSCRHVAFSA